MFYGKFIIEIRTDTTCKKNILPIITPFSLLIYKNWPTIDADATSSKPLSAYSKSSSIHSQLVPSAQTWLVTISNTVIHILLGA